MIATGKLHIVVNTEVEGAGLNCPEVTGMADAVLRVVEGTKFSVLEIRMVMQSEQAHEFLLGMLLGRMELSIEDVTPVEGTDGTSSQPAEMN